MTIGHIISGESDKEVVEMSRKLLLSLLLHLALNLVEVEPSADIMNQMSIGFSKALDECKAELNIQDHILTDLYNYWKEDYALLNRDFGCAIICMSKKLNLLDPDGNLHHGNTAEFAKKHGADDDMANKLISIIRECDKPMDDPCIRVLEMAKCFRTKIHELKWAPSMDVVIEEVLTEV